MRVIHEKVIIEAVRGALLKANYIIGDDILQAFNDSLNTEESAVGVSVIEQLIENSKIAREQSVPLCQDTGMVVMFVEYGTDVVIDGDFGNAVNEGVTRAYAEGFLRKSVVKDPVFERDNTTDNTPAIVHTQLVQGDKIRILCGCKGFGSENMSGIRMLSPSQGIDGVKRAILDIIEHAGPNPCPPIIVGIGIGGTFEYAALLAKKATFRDVNSRNPNPQYAELEKQLLKEINCMGYGPAGLGGTTTALGVNIETYPTHIAGLPVAVNISCHATRHSQIVI